VVELQSDGYQNGSRERYEVREHDVLIIGAGGAGLRAAVSATQRGLSVGIVTKSLLGKAHTVMAEGGMAAALGNVDSDDSWRQHFIDTMRSGKFINNWRMAEIHAKESPDRVYELEQWGALFNRTPEGKISQRPFGGHTHRRLAHVGDRTGLELIRTMQEKTLATDAKVYMETTVTKLFKKDGRVVGRPSLHPRVGQVRPLQGEGGRDGDRRLGPNFQGYLQLLGGHRRRRHPLL
jgi:succinate dehydrogenase / fumarate reductase flavoprotein subunit